MSSKLLYEIGSRLKMRRQELKLTQREVADLLDISLNFYGDTERGVKRLSIEKIILIQEKLGLDPTYLLTGVKPPELNLNQLLLECPAEKRQDFEELMKHASNLYKYK
ncbi:helix-turn-helix transcriptional regulator [Anaerocolumna sp. AGMB13025]|uniref:helix-turn-helix domain-containing protein n=1 Tax=Anaerocolumna sp. AGMB13025 TaxID=3039116 RepID=UPI00241F5552|nr:helix-turn-helix transcriptional regulator [Anaerocolumna sp. AGMB13025]WFR56517.1 helix-turn-helix transcriptional regulator [Anaerocolumna sp. AGMB13025]